MLLLAAQTRSIVELAAVTGVELKRLHYHITALRTLGLLVVAREQRRGGRPIKFYKAVAHAFFVPAELMPQSPSAALDTELRSALAKQRERSRSGMLYHLGEAGEPRLRPISTTQPNDGGAGAEHWRVLRLSPADAQRLAEQIDRCVKSFATRDTAAAKDYLVHFACAPRATSMKRRSKATG